MGLFGLGSGSMGKGANSQQPDFTKAYIATGDDGKPYVKDPAKLWREVIELRDDSLSNRKPHERMWALSWMFYKGDQWRKPAPAPDWNIIRINVGRKPKITINKILPMVQTRRAHVLKNRPTGVVMPRTLDEEDRNASRVAQDVLNYDQQHLKNWEILDGKLSLCMFVTGNAFKKIYFDPTKGDKKEQNKYQLDPETGAPVTVPSFQGHGGSPEEDMQNPAAPFASSDMGVASTSAGPASEKGDLSEKEPDHTQENLNQTDTGLTFGEKPILEGTEEEPEGDVVIEYVPPEEILPEPAATSLDDCQRLLHRTLKPLKWVKDTFGTSAEDVEPINVKSEKGKATVNGAKMFGMTEREVANRVEVLEAWFRPSTEYPDGLHAVWADDKLMAAGPTPEAHEAIPFVHYAEIETDEFWGISSVSQVIDPQKALNLAISRDEFMRQRLRPKLMAPTESGLDESAYSNDDSEIVFYNHPFIPKFTEPPPFERDEKAVGFFKEAVDDIGGSADVMRGQIQGTDIRSGRMVNYLQEYAGTVLAGPARAIERGEEKTGNMILRLRKHYTTEPKIYYIVGRNRNVEVKQFIGSDIEGAADYVVQAGSALPMSMAEKRDMVLSLVEKGILPPGDPRIVKMLGMPSDIDEMFNEDQLDRDNATEEDQKFLGMTEEVAAQTFGALLDFQNQMAPGAAEVAGIKPTPGQVLDSLDLAPKDFENHIVHLETHNRSRKSKAYKQLPKAVQGLYDEHCDMHAMFLLPPPGAPGEAPGGAGGEKPQGKEGPDKNKPGSPSALQGGKPPGPGGAGDVNAQGNQERSEGMPPTRQPPGVNDHHLR